MDYVFSGDNFHSVSTDLNSPWIFEGVSVSKQQGVVGLREKKMPICCSFHLLLGILRCVRSECFIPFMFVRGMHEESILLIC